MITSYLSVDIDPAFVANCFMVIIQHIPVSSIPVIERDLFRFMLLS